MGWLGKSIGSAVSGANLWLGKAIGNGSDFLHKSKRVIGSVMDRYAKNKKNILGAIDNFDPSLGNLARKGVNFVEGEIGNTVMGGARPFVNLLTNNASPD